MAKSEEQSSLGRQRSRQDNIKMALKYTEWQGTDWTHLAQDCNHYGNYSSSSIKFGDLLDYSSNYQLLKKYSAL